MHRTPAQSSPLLHLHKRRSMDDMAAYYHPPPPESIHTPQYPYYQPPLTHPSPLGAAQPPPMAVVPQPHQFQPQHHQQPPFAPYAPQSYIPQASYDEVRTLFVAGLPPDVKSREIYNLFREFPGYESSHLRTSASTQVVYFIL